MDNKRNEFTRRRGFLIPAALCCLFLCAAGAQEASGPPSPTPEQSVTMELIDQARATLAAQEGLDEAVRTQVTGLYDEAQKQLKLGMDSRAKAAEFDRMREEAPKLAEELKAWLAEATAGDLQLPPEEASLSQIEVELSNAEADFRSRQDSFDELLREPVRRRQRRREIPSLQADVRKRLQEARTAASESTPQNGASPEVAAAQRMAAQARAFALSQELSAFERELLFYDARAAIISLRQEEAHRLLTQAEARFKALQERTQVKRKEEAQLAAEEARQALDETVGQDERIADIAYKLAETNTTLAEMRTGDEGLAEHIEQTNKKVVAETARLDALNQSYQAIVDRISASGLNSVVGTMMRQQKSDLPDVYALGRAIDERKDKISEVEIAQSLLREGRLELGDSKNEFQTRLDELSGELSNLERAKLQRVVSDLIQSQRELLDALDLDYDRYFTELLALTSVQQDLINQTEIFKDYINENILWIGGEPPIGVNTPRDAFRALIWLGDPAAWTAAPLQIFGYRHANLLLHFGLTIGILWWLYVRYRGLKELAALAAAAKNRRNTSHVPATRAFILSIVSAAWLPAFLYWCGWTLAGGAAPIAQAAAAGMGLMAAAPLAIVPETARILLRPDGLAVAHFGWPAKHAAAARRYIALLLVSALPLATLYLVFENQEDASFKESAGRIALIAVLLLTAITIYRLSGILKRGMIDLRRRNWYTDQDRLRLFARLLAVVLPVGLAVVASTGYFYSAQQLSSRLYLSLALLLAIAIVIGMIRRWLLLTRRGIAIEQARRRREALKAEAEKRAKAKKKAAAESTGEEPLPGTLSESKVQLEAELSDEELDIVKVDTQTQSLVRTGAFFTLIIGMWFIWADFVPALNILDDFTVWQVEQTIQKEVAQEDGTTIIETTQSLRNVTYANLGMALLIIFIATAAVRNLPGLLEIILLQRLKMGSGERYATLSIVRYTLTAVGGVMAFNAIGIGWERVQWLVAALSVGLGFGLQEIFANFVSGLILLFERPIRVGDTVTIGNLSGTVTQIRIRATTITDWDRKELIVPNREFVTGQLINWSLSDTVLRATIPVGIAYGSDTKKAMDVMYKAVASSANALKDPPPQVCFLGFGDSSLDFEVRVFCQSVDYYIPLRHEIHLAIDNGFREAGVEIPFPQRDVHFRSSMEVVDRRKIDSGTEAPGEL